MQDKIKRLWAKLTAPRKWVRVVSRILLGFFILIIATYVGLAWYINTHKEEVQANLLKELNGGLTGSLTIQKMEATFLQGLSSLPIYLK